MTTAEANVQRWLGASMASQGHGTLDSMTGPEILAMLLEGAGELGPLLEAVASEAEPHQWPVEPRSGIPATTRPSLAPIASASPTLRAALDDLMAVLRPSKREPFSIALVDARCAEGHAFPRGGTACWCGKRTRRLEEALTETLTPHAAAP